MKNSKIAILAAALFIGAALFTSTPEITSIDSTVEIAQKKNPKKKELKRDKNGASGGSKQGDFTHTYPS